MATLTIMRRRTAWWIGLGALLLVAVVVAAALVTVELQRTTIEVEMQLAEPFLALDERATLHQDYGRVLPDPLGADLGSVSIVFETADPDGMVERIQATMRAEGWERKGSDGHEWHSGGGDLGHRWGLIQIEGDDVTLFIGRIEG